MERAAPGCRGFPSPASIEKLKSENYPSYKLPDLDELLIVLTLLSVSTVLIWLVIQRIEERTTALRESEERLRRANLTLEQRVAERTALARARAEQLRMLANFLFHAARELLFNVIKHAEVNQARVELRLEADRGVVLTVADKGVGFVPSESGREDPDGGRFGLFSILERIRLLDGRMGIQSAPGAGTRISLSVPLPTEPEVANPPPVKSGESVTATLEKRQSAVGISATAAVRIRALVADDHAMMRDGLCGLLERQPDLEIVGLAEDGSEAVELALRLRPDVIIMDVSMPQLNGIEATRRILAELPNTRIIALSMHADPDIAEEMRRSGAVDYIAKTGAASRLVAAIRASVAVQG